MIRRLLREPLLHFLVLGAALFAAYDVLRRASPSATEIVVTADTLKAIDAQFAAAWHRPPSESEHQALVDTYVRDEVLFREGLALGLDRDDPVIRNRVKQKMEFLGDDRLAAEPTDTDLAAYLEAHRAQFEIPAAVSFEQVYFDPARHGRDLDRVLANALESLTQGRSRNAAGDRTMLAARMDRAMPPDISTTFGPEFAGAIGRLPVGTWQGPVRSTFGFHLVRITWRGEATMPALADARDVVAREWSRARAAEMRVKLYEALRGRYVVKVEPLARTTARAGGQ